MSLVGEMATVAGALERVEDIAEDSEEMDARVAAIIHLQQLQNKQEVMQLLEAHAVSNADTEFRMQLEELVRDHLNTCMALASCSTSHDTAHISPTYRSRGDSSETHHLLSRCSAEQCHHHQPYDRVVEKEEGENDEGGRLVVQQPSVTSDASSDPTGCLTPQSGVVGRWDERQGIEPTPREREVREAELLALASLHTVSTLDASFLQGSPSPRTQSSIERPHRLSSLFRMWRELEGERGETERHQTPEIIRTSAERDETRPRAATVESSMIENVSHLNEDRRNEVVNAIQSVAVDTHEHMEAEVQESNNSISTPQVQEADATRIEMQELDGERERVRLMVRRWMRESGVAENEAATNPRSNSRVEWLAEDERERVRRMSREWARVTNFQTNERLGERQGVTSHEQRRGISTQTQNGRIGSDADRQREMILELLVRSEQERQREIASILEHRTVSEFAHRSRLQSFLRGRFLRNRGSTDVNRPPSSAAGEIGQLRQRRAVSGLREGFRFRLETIVRSQSNSGFNDEQSRLQENQQIVPQASTPATNSSDLVTNLEEILTNSEGDVSNSEDRVGRDHVVNRRATVEETVGPHHEVNRRVAERGGSHHEENQSVANEERVVRDRLANRRTHWTHELQSLEDATAYNMELRELLSRQSVTTMLASEFRDRLDELIRSFIRTQGRTPRPWNLSRTRQSPGATQQEQGPQRGQVQGERRANGTEVPPPPPLPSPVWQQSLQQALQESIQQSLPQSLPRRGPPRPHLLFDHERMVMHQPTQPTWSRSAAQRSGDMEWETTSRALRTDVAVLQRNMNELREMMETSIQMQFELQRSIRQEVSGALQRMYGGKEIPPEALDGSKWTSVKKGTCCICCDKQVDCLLYRCGHMCTCVKCAKELHNNNGRCPMCRATIVEVVRAFTIS